MTNPTAGLSFTRMCIALASTSTIGEAREFAASRWARDAQPQRLLRAAVSAGSTTGGNWAEDLAAAESARREFLALVRRRSVVGRLGLRRVPLRVRTVSATAGTSAAWVAEGAPKPLTRMTLTASTLAPLKVAAIAVLTDELIASADPDAEITLRNDMVAAAAEAIDAAFLDPDNAGAAGEMPAAVTNGVVPVSAAAVFADGLRALIEDFAGDLDGAVIVARPEIFALLAGTEHPHVGARGGDLAGIPALPSQHVPDDQLVLLDPGRIVIGEGAVSARATRQASVEMADDPEQPAVLVSLWQANLTGLLIEQPTNWSAAGGAVSVLSLSTEGS